MKPNLTDKPSTYFVQTRKEMLPFVPNGCQKVLELGCGEGVFASQVKETYPSVELWGLELDTHAADEAKKTFDMVLVGTLEEQLHNVPNGTFDAIVCNDILEHLVNPFEVLTELKKKLSAQGVLVCSIPNVRYIDNLWNLLIKKQWKYEDAGILDKTHLRFFTKKSIIDTAHATGYEVEKMEGINGYETSPLFRLLILLSFGYLADTAPLQYACVLRPLKKL